MNNWKIFYNINIRILQKKRTRNITKTTKN